MNDFSTVTSWPFVEARKVIKRMEKSGKEIAVFETGYGPSGLPHIGTFAEVVRTNFIRRAYTVLTGKPSRLIAFSDDMDALRKVPDNVPNKEILNDSIGLPLTMVPDPYETYNSFAEHNNTMLIRFLSECGFNDGEDYEFYSSTNVYKSGLFNDALKRMADCHDEIVKVVVPTLGKERAQTWSPFMPIHPVTGRVMMVPVTINDGYNITWNDPDSNEEYTTSILNGNCKIQWKADWALRWYALGIDYEMSGKDLIDSVKLSTKICKILGGQAPINLTYELFLDLDGTKISKSKGNGVSVDEWLKYSDITTLSHMIFPKPQTAKRIGIPMIPKSVDEFLANVHRLNECDEVSRWNNPAWFAIGKNNIADFQSETTYQMLLNLANVTNSTNKEVFKKFVEKSFDLSIPENSYTESLLNSCVFYEDVFSQLKNTREPTEMEKEALLDLVSVLEDMEDGLTGEQYQYEVYEVGKRHPFNPLRDWFKCIYEVTMGQSDGPRFGQFIALYGRQETIDLICKSI